MILYNEIRKEIHIKEVLQSYINKDKKFDIGVSLQELYKELKEGYKWSSPKLVRIPKSNGGEREIFIFNDKDSFVLKLLNSAFTNVYSHKLSENSFAYRKGTRCYDAANYIQDRIKGENPMFGVKADISNYFQSVPNTAIMNIVNNLVKDEWGRKLLSNLFSINKVIHKDVEVEEYLGIMPGSALSSFFANIILTDIDNKMKDICGTYARYSDDIMILCDTEEDLNNSLDIFKKELKVLGLTIKDSKLKFYSQGESIDFLSLEITKDYIDVIPSTYKNIQKVIKTICKESRRLCEKSSHDRKVVVMSDTITKIQKKLFYSMLLDSDEHKGGRMSYVFSNITKSDNLQQLDYYMLDQIRYIYSGKHNKGLVSKFSTEVLEDMGFVSFVKLYNLYRKNKFVAIQEISSMIFSKKFKGYKDYDLSSYSEIKSNLNFSDIYYDLIESGSSIIVGDKTFNAIDIVFDIKYREIRVGDLLIAKGNKVVNKFLIKDKQGYGVINAIGNKVCNNRGLLVDEEELFRLYANASFRADYSGVDMNKQYRPFPFKINKIAKLSLTLGDMIEYEVPYIERYSTFMGYLYFNIMANNKWSTTNREYSKFSNKDYFLFINKEWYNN